MKRIFLAKKLKRILARVVDVMITLVVTILIFSFFVMPNTLDMESIKANGNEITTLYNDSGLFFVDEDGNYNAYSGFQNVKELKDLYSVNCEFNGSKKEVSLTKSLYIFYTTKFVDYGNQFNLTLDTYKKDILKIGSQESNIKDYDEVNNVLTLIDENKADVTVYYFVDVYSNVCKDVIANSKIADLTALNQTLVINSLLYLIPVLIGVTFVFELLIPLFSPCCETIGKHIFELGVLSHDGYRLKKGWLIVRWLSYVAIEFILGVFTFGATVLISYTMFLFTKKRRCVHDFIAKTVVIEKAGSIYFASAKEENYYIEHYGNEDRSYA